MYRQGLGVQQDDKEAYTWFSKSAAQGDPQGCSQLAEMCLQGLGCDVDNSRALQLFRQAAELGHSDAQYNLAMLYETGRIVELITSRLPVGIAWLSIKVMPMHSSNWA